MRYDSFVEKRTKRAIIIPCVIVGSLTVLYFGGGTIAGLIAFDSIFNSRQSSLAKLETDDLRVYKTRNDYPVMSNRSIETFQSDNNVLTGYFYQVTNPKGNVLCFHGMRGLADGLDAQYQQWFLSRSYNVFAIDMTACGSSEGNRYEGICQSPKDVSNAYFHFKETHSNLENLKTYFVGHSWGAYGSAAAAYYGAVPDGVITFSAFDIPTYEMLDMSRRYIGVLTDITYPNFFIASQLRYGEKAKISAKTVLKDHPTIRSLHFYGTNDKTVYPQDALYTGIKNDPIPNAKIVSLEGVGHSVPWLTMNAKNAADDHKKHLKSLTGEEKETYIQSIDKEKTSELSPKVFDEIALFLNE